MTGRAPTRGIEDLVEGLLGMSIAVQHAVAAVAARHDLTPQQLGLLRVLEQPLSMRELADDRSCDPSNVTGLVDRVERLGLVERVPSPIDRRVRMLCLTDEGRRVRDLFNRELVAELCERLGLRPDDGAQTDRLLEALAPVLDKPAC